MNVVIISVVRCHELERIKGNAISAVVVDSLEGGQGEEDHRLAGGHKCACFSEDRSNGIEKKALDGVVIERSESVWDIKAMVPRVEVPVQPFIDMHPAMKEILPCIDEEPASDGETDNAKECDETYIAVRS